MSEIIRDEFGVTEYKGVAIVSSRFVADVFGKRHDNVIKAIERAECSENFRNLHFKVSFYREGKGKYKEYLLTKDGFAFVVMGFTGKKAAQFKEAYINRFNQMADFIKSLSAAKLEFPEFTAAIMAIHEEPKHYHFSNEINMINRIVLGMDAKQYKVASGIPEEAQSIRPYLSVQDIKGIESLQRFDIGLMITHPDFQERKAILTNYYSSLNELKLLKAISA